MVVNSNCYRTFTSNINMATYFIKVLFMFCSVHSICIFVESKTLESVHVPYNVPMGRVITRITPWGSHSRFHCIDGEAEGLFAMLENGNLIRSYKGNLTGLVGRTVSFITKHLDTQTHDVIHLKVLEQKMLLYFLQHSYSGTVKENELPNTQIRLDTELHAVSVKNSLILYSIKSGDSNKFDLDHIQSTDYDTVVVRTKVLLDREEQDEYVLVVQAESDAEFVECTVNIIVIDQDDNAPVFSQHFYFAAYSEPVPDKTKIWRLQAFDPDLGLIYYSLLDDTNFSINPETGDVYTKSTGFLSPGDYTTQAFAVDESGHTSELAELSLNIGETLKFMPNFQHRSKRDVVQLLPMYIEVEENGTDLSMPLFSVSSQPTVSGEQYQLVYSSVDLFQLDINGNVYLQDLHKLDYENHDHQTIYLQFNITNSNDPEDIMLRNVTVTVKDKNDENPVFKNKPEPFFATVSSNANAREDVYTLLAEDLDTNSSIKYYMQGVGGKFLVETEEDQITNERVGRVKTAVGGPQQFPEGEMYDLRVWAEDENAPRGMRQSTPVKLLKVVVGFREPQFHENPYRAQVMENNQDGFKLQTEENTILVVRAKSFQNKPLTYLLRDEFNKTSSLFRINSAGEVETTRSLDFEDPLTPHQYTLNLIAEEEDTDLRSIGQMIVNLVDGNDEDPTFQRSTYTYVLGENSLINDKLFEVVATDKDSGLNAQLTYTVTDDHFEVETVRVTGENGYEYKGIIKLVEPLDYDNQPDHLYAFQVIATDHGESRNNGKASVLISVTNINDEKPKFVIDLDHLYAKVREDQEPPTVVTTVQAVDPDGDSVLFYFEGGQETSGPFRIYPASGLIVLKDSLSPDIPSYELSITAVDDGSCCGSVTRLSSNTVIVIEVTDVNYERPEFTNCSFYAPTIEENQAAGTSVITVMAIDNDRGQNGNVTYSVISSAQRKSFFDVNPVTGEVTTQKLFDRELNQAKLLTVKAEDHGEPQQLMSFCTFWVHIEDKNDNPPRFDANYYTVTVPRDKGVNNRFSYVRATDEDLGKNGLVRYSLVENPGNYFRIDEESGILYLDQPISSVAESSFDIKIRAEDQGDNPLSSEVILTVLLGPNEYPAPIWVRDDYEGVYTVEETAPPGTQIASFIANPNSNEPGVFITFDLVDSDGSSRNLMNGIRLSSEGNTAILKVDGGLDYNIQNVIELRLRVTNPTLPNLPLSNAIRIVINLIDTNNKIPVFEGLEFKYNTYQAQVPENEAPGQKVITITAIDADHDSPNNVLTYALEPSDQLFQINPQTGQITTTATFDRESQSYYSLNVVVTDGADSTKPGADPTKPNAATARILVSVSDRNDNSPHFPEDLYKFEVKETTPVESSTIIQVQAEDVDTDDTLIYTIVNGVESAYKFGIRQKTGDIYVARPLDYETPPTEYTLKVMAHDGIHNDTTNVKITILDENDNPPVFDPDVYILTEVVEEEEPPPGGQFLVMVHATDKDKRENNIQYSLSGYGTATLDPFFRIDPTTGEIWLLRKLDRDLPNGRSEYEFNVEAIDEPEQPATALTGYAYVTIKPKDINDNKPRFKDNIQGSVPENSPVGQSVMTVVAEDYDAGENGTVIYFIDPHGSIPSDAKTGYPLFTIERETGLVKSNTDTLDRETVDIYFLPVLAKDKGVEQKNATTTVVINISDENDQKPVFVQKIYEVVMSENLRSGPVTTVSATDNDIGENAKLTYTLRSSDAVYFSMESVPPNAAVLYVFKPVDYEYPLQRKFNLTVQVRDENHDHVDEAYVVITVEDYNDNAPQFHPAEGYSMEIDENVKENTELHTFSASDKDSTINAEFEYKIDRSTDPGHRFSIDPEAGVVTVRIGLDGFTLDRETNSEHNIRILAIDKGDPPMTGHTTLRITVNDLNDNAPEFAENYRPVVMENTAPVQDVIVFKAMDRDTNRFGPPFHFQLPSCAENPTCGLFEMDFQERETGNIGIVTGHRMFDREENKYFYLPVIMSDMYKENSTFSRTATRTLTIQIGDENDNEHQKGHKDIFVYNYKGQFGDFVIGNVHAEDPDDWDVTDKHFYFVGPKAMANYFSVDFDSGNITMAKNVPPGRHAFTAKVHDYVVFTRINATATVTVIVEEITDEAVYNSGSMRLKGMTTKQFIKVKDKNPSAYDKFRNLLAQKLVVPSNQVFIFSVMRNGEFTDIRYAAHGSPFYASSTLDGIVSFYKDEFLKELGSGVEIVMVNIDECLKEICESGGCSNILVVSNKPALVNTDETSFVGVSTRIDAECSCKAQNFSDKLECSANYCLNGGTCTKDDWGDLSCACSSEFDGKRCQMTRHNFYGEFALFAPLAQCEDSTTTIEFLTKNKNGLIMYNGPVEHPMGLLDLRDFISLELINGYPKLQIDHGTGELVLYISGRDNEGNTLVNQLADSKWHKIDIIRKGREVTMVIDNCKDVLANRVNMDFTACKASGKTPGENIYLNVNAMLQLGGRYGDQGYPPNLAALPFMGCIRNLRHNGELYDLYTSPHAVGNKHENGCPEEDRVCGGGIRGGHCGENGFCELLNSEEGDYHCICDPGYRVDDFTQHCSSRTYVRDLKQQSFITWTLSNQFYNKVSSLSTWLQVSFRTRDMDGLLLHLPSNNQDYITLELEEGHVQVSYKLKNSESAENTLKLDKAQASNGQWHTLEMHRVGQWFQLKMDSGEGRYYAETWGSLLGSRIFEVSISKIVLGARVVLREKAVFDGQDLSDTCIDDVRMDNEWFPLKSAWNEESKAARIDFESNLEDDCVRNDCAGVTCPTGYPKSKVCYAVWGHYECRCEEGYESQGQNCVEINYCDPSPCSQGSSCLKMPPPKGFRCICPPNWTGDICNQRKETVVASAGMTTEGLIIIIVSVFAVLIIALLIIMWYNCHPQKSPEKYILYVDPDDDVRENVINYDEEGAGEEDQDGYDISRLRKPGDIDSVVNPLYDLGLTTIKPLGKAPPKDRPDVGNFINDRLDATDDDMGAPPFDNVQEFEYEGGGSDAGSLSSLNTSASSGDQDYDYLNEWGPKFSKLADMYGADQEDEL